MTFCRWCSKRVTDEAMNRDIKELCKLAGINEEIRPTL